jgi:predicted N-acetyltransferase YhbS
MITHPAYTIRDAAPHERAAAQKLTIAAYAQFEASMEPTAWEGLHAAVLAALDAPGPFDHIVADQNGTLVGSVMLFPPAASRDTSNAGGRMIWPELRLLAVAPSARGQGVGGALVQACVERARAAGATGLGLYTSDSMRTAMALYERLGFTRVPAYDFHPAGNELVKAFVLELPNSAT